MKTTSKLLPFYVFCGVLGFFLLVIDTTIGHSLDGHLHLFMRNHDIVAGVILIFFASFHIGVIVGRMEVEKK